MLDMFKSDMAIDIFANVVMSLFVITCIVVFAIIVKLVLKYVFGIGKYSIKEKDIFLIDNLIHIDKSIKKYNSAFMLTIPHTVGRLVKYKIDTVDKWNEFIKYFKGSL